jgi:hypothetical protein
MTGIAGCRAPVTDAGDHQAHDQHSHDFEAE